MNRCIAVRTVRNQQNHEGTCNQVVTNWDPKKMCTKLRNQGIRKLTIKLLGNHCIARSYWSKGTKVLRIGWVVLLKSITFGLIRLCKTSLKYLFPIFGLCNSSARLKSEFFWKIWKINKFFEYFTVNTRKKYVRICGQKLFSKIFFSGNHELMKSIKGYKINQLITKTRNIRA